MKQESNKKIWVTVAKNDNGTKTRIKFKCKGCGGIVAIPVLEVLDGRICESCQSGEFEFESVQQLKKDKTNES